MASKSCSVRTAPTILGFTQLFTISVDGGFPTPVDLPMAYDGSFSGDSSRLAYLPISPAFEAWKRYRGGETTSIWLANLSDAKVEKIPRENSNDFNPIWIGDKVYFPVGSLRTRIAFLL